MKLVAVTTTAYLRPCWVWSPLLDGRLIRKTEPLRSKISGPLPDPFRLFSLGRIAGDLGRFPAHLVLHGREPGQVDRLPDHHGCGLAEFGRHLVEFLACLLIYSNCHHIHDDNVTRIVLRGKRLAVRSGHALRPARLSRARLPPHPFSTTWRRIRSYA